MSEQTAAVPKESAALQPDLPFAFVQGEAITQLPKDLFIPPDALEVFLDAFEGPLDLLLYLIKRQNLDILDIPIAEITQQYTQYIELMTDMRLELAAEYLVMAAMLAEIKSRLLLPRPVEEDSDENDPRAELIRRLQEYERYKQAAQDIDALPQTGTDVFLASGEPPKLELIRPDPEVNLQDVLVAFADVLRRSDLYTHHRIHMEPLSVRERMSMILSRVKHHEFSEFTSFFNVEEGRQGVVVTLLAILELVKESLIELVQTAAYAAIHIKARSALSVVDVNQD